MVAPGRTGSVRPTLAWICAAGEVRTVNGTAKTGGNDYNAKTGTLTFNPGEPLTKTITIEVKGDRQKPGFLEKPGFFQETFYLNLFGNGSNSLFTKNRGIGTILNDD